MRTLVAASLVALSTCIPRLILAAPEDIARSFAEYELGASRATDDTKRRELESERDAMAKLWCDGVAEYVRQKLDAKQFPVARLVAADGLEQMRKHPALGICTDKLEAALRQAIREEFVLMDADGHAGHVMRAVDRGRSLLATRPSDTEIQNKLKEWQRVARKQADQTIAEAKQAALPGAELLAMRLAEVIGDTSSKPLAEQVKARMSRRPQYSFSGQACSALQRAKLPAPAGEPLAVELVVERCVEDTAVREGMESYTYTAQIPYTYEAAEGSDCTTEKERHVGKASPTDKVGWVDTTTRTCTPRMVTKTGYKSVTATGQRLVKHRVTSLELRGVVVVAESRERFAFEARDSFDDEQYESGQDSHNFTGEGPGRMAAKAAEAIAPSIESLLTRERARRGQVELKRAEVAAQAKNWLELEDALVHIAEGGMTPPAELIALIAERHSLSVVQMRSLLSSPVLLSELPIAPEPIARIPEAQWTVEKDKVTNDRATEHFNFAIFSLLYGHPKGGGETGRFGLALGGVLHSPVKSIIVPSLMSGFRIGLDHDLRFLYDLRAGLGVGSRLGPLQLRAYGIAGFDRIAMGDHYELPSAWTYGGEGHLDLEITRFTAIGLEGVLQKRTSGPTGGRLEKRLRARILVLGADLSGFSFGASVEDYGIGRVYGVFVGSD